MVHWIWSLLGSSVASTLDTTLLIDYLQLPFLYHLHFFHSFLTFFTYFSIKSHKLGIKQVWDCYDCILWSSPDDLLTATLTQRHALLSRLHKHMQYDIQSKKSMPGVLNREAILPIQVSNTEKTYRCSHPHTQTQTQLQSTINEHNITYHNVLILQK